MPRKESTISAAAVSSAQAQQESASDGIEAFELPKSLVTRIARSAFPDNVKLQKEAMLALLKGSTVFVNYIAATAHDVAVSKQHKSISASDVLKALEVTQFGDMVDKLQDELQAYRDLQKPDKPRKSNAKGKTKEVDSASASASTAKAKGKQKAVIVIPGSRSVSAQLPPPSSEPEPDVANETEDDARIIRAPSEAGDEELPEEEEEDVDEDIEDEDEEEVDEDEDEMEVEALDLGEEARALEGRTLESREDQDTQMDT
ncbi:histone-fold-containing protein [Cristinia sonorae]|uniref:DNA polymerase epsilon subunit D n=1 Tax=Cristinia sonorae TaxID=1940300 RepID=A0A8K0UUP3_9AGAR|nr:histone-fold-containing protein [Cristinia sonorae]